MSGPFSTLEHLGPDDRELLARLLQREQASQPGREVIPCLTMPEGPLSFAQRRLWVADQLRQGDAAYNLYIAFRARGPLRSATLARSLTEIVHRHGVLRSTVHVRDGEPYLRVNPPEPLELQQIDVAHFADHEREVEAARVVGREVHRPFQLSEGPLFRASLVRLGSADHVLVLSMHHIVSDGWSIGVITNELAALYAAFLDGRASPLADLPIQYGDAAAWSRTRLSGAVLDRLTGFWRAELEGAARLELPTDYPRPTTPATRGAGATLTLDRNLMSRVDQLARQEGATRFMVLHAAFALLLSRYSGQQDIVIGVPVAARDRAELEPLVGLFVNVLPVRLQLLPSLSVRALIGSARERTLAAFDHQDLPFDLIADAVGAERAVDRHPVFQMTFGAQDAFVRTIDSNGLRLEPFDLPADATRFDLEVHVLQSGAEARVGIVYSPELFDAATIDRLFDHYRIVLDGMSRDPDQRVDAVGLLSAAARLQILQRFNATVRSYPRDRSIHAVFSQHAAAQPDGVAVSCRDEQLTYAELERHSNQLAHRLRRHGVTTNTGVGVCLERSVNLIIALLGVLKAGGAYVALDPAYPASRLAHMADESRLTVAISQRTVANSLPVSISTTLLLDDMAAELDGEPDTPPIVDTRADDLAYVSYTSGSTGQPKGAEIPHRAVLRLVLGSDFIRFGPDETFLQLGPVTFDASTLEIWGALLHGARLVVYPERVPQIDELAAVLRHARVTTLWLTSSLFNTVIDQAPEALSGVRQLLTGGEALSVAHVRRGLSALPNTHLFNGYGPTEATVFATVYPITAAALTEASASVPIGGPVANTRVYVLDATLEPVPIGVAGELFIGGDGVGRGYANAPGLTAGKFVPDPFGPIPGARLYRTGDSVRWRADGVIEFLGRRDGQVKIRGHRIELGEIESAVTGYPGVQSAVVAVHGADTDRKQLVAYVVSAPGRTIEPAALRSFVKNTLPDYMVPAVVVPIDRLPLTPNGKVDRSALPAPSIGAAAGAGSTIRTSAEAQLAVIWAEVLRLPRVGIHDNFFEVGGDSILSIQIAARASALGLRIAPRHFFEHQTVAELAALASGAAVANGLTEAVGCQPGEATGQLPLTPIAHWFFQQGLPSPHHFNQSVLLELPGPVSASAVERALTMLSAHHDVLRSRFIRENGCWRHLVDASITTVPVVDIDLASSAPDRQAAAIEAVANGLQASLDLGEGPLFTAALFHGASPASSPGAWSARLLLVAHHLIVDGVSWRILLEDLPRALDAAGRHQAATLPAKTASFKQWAEHLVSPAALVGGENEAAMWTRMSDAGGELPVNRPDSLDRNTWGRSATVSCTCGADDTDALLRIVPGVYDARVHEVLTAAIATALGAWTGRDRVVMALESHGRQAMGGSLDVSRTVGWFTAIHPLCVSLPGGDEIATLESVVQQLRRIPDGGAGYGVLRYLNAAPPDRVLHGARPQISVNYLGQFDQVWSDTMRLATEPAGAPVAPVNPRPYLIDVNARIAGGRLTVDWSYGEDIHHRPTIENLAQAAMANVRAVIEGARRHRLAPDRIDVRLAALDHTRLGRLLQRYVPAAGSESGAAVEAVYPLTPLQLGMLVHSLANRGSDAFISQIELVLDRGLDVDVLREAWRAIQAAHPILRTAFVDAGDGEFRQVVFRHADVSVSEADLSALPEPARAERLDQLLQGERQQPFALGVAPLMRVGVVRVGPARSHLVWTHHHALLDGWSVAMILDELLGRLADCRPADDASAVVRREAYAGYLEWLQRQDRGAAEVFWRRFLDGVTAPTVLAADRRSRSTGEGPAIEEQETWLAPDLTAQLATLAARQHLTLSTIVQAAWALVLARHSGEREVVFGIAVSGRPPEVPGIERVIGMLLNGVPTRVHLPSSQRVCDWLADVQRQQVAIRQYEWCSLSQIQGWSAVPRQLPLFETTLAFENYPVADALSDSGRVLGVSQFKLVAHTSAALHLRAIPGERLRLMISYDRHRFDSGLVSEILGQLAAIFEQCVARPEATVGEISLRTASSAARLPAQSIGELAEWPGGVHEQISERAAAAGDRVAIDDAAGTVSYRELEQWSNEIAGDVLAAGVPPGGVVGVDAVRGPALVAAMLGILRAGAAFTIVDRAYPVSRALHQLESAGVEVVVSPCESSDLPPALAAWQGVERHRMVRIDARATSVRPTRPIVCRAAGPDDLAYVAFTSGSTGKPKGVLGRHAALAHYSAWLGDTFAADAADRVSMLSALSHDPLLRDVFPTLQLGGTVCVPPADGFGRAGALREWLASARVTVANLSPALALLLTDGSDRRPLASLRLALFVGEPLTAAIVSRVRELAPGVTCVNLYGTTESQQALSYHVIPQESTLAIAPIGRGIAHTSLLVVTQDGSPAGVGEVGEIWIGSPLLARGYLNDEESTRARFSMRGTGESSVRAYRTGDRGWYLPNGEVVLTGRQDDQIQVRGFRVEPAEVEAALSALPDVREAAVAAARDAGGASILVAYVAGTLSPEALQDRLRAMLPAAMVPSRIVDVAGLPRTATGKIDRQALAALAAADAAAADADDALVHPPITPVEIALAALWAGVLEVDGVGRDQSFFALGGHSLSAARLVARVRDAFDVEIEVADLFERPHLAELAAHVQAQVRAREDLLSQLVDEIGELSPEELQAILDAAGAADAETSL